MMAAGLALLYGRRRWLLGTKRLNEAVQAARLPCPTGVYSSRELVGLPASVQRFFRAALTDGQRAVAHVTLEQTGTFNQSETVALWKPFTASQHSVMRRPGYVWDARIRMFPGVAVRVRDAYVAGEGILQAAVVGLFPVANLRDRGELARGELIRFFAEAAWYPTALLPSQGVRWDDRDGPSVKATLCDGSLTVSLQFGFNPDGLIGTVRAEARGRTVGSAVTQMPWEGRFWNYTKRDGMHIPLEGEVAWIHPEGPKPYWRGRIAEIAYEFAA